MNSRSPLAERVPRLWTLWAAARPSQVALILLVYVLGVGMATTGSPVTRQCSSVSSVGELTALQTLTPILVGGLALVPAAVSIHYANEYVDVETDAMTNRTPFSGGSGALDRTGLPAAFLRSATVASLGVTALTVAVIAGTGTLSPPSIVILVSILLAGLAYSLPPLAFIRRGVGELINASLGGLLLPLYGAATIGRPTVTAALAVLPFTLVVGCNLLATHWADREADRSVGKRTLAVRLSTVSLRRLYVVLSVAAGAATVLVWITGAIPTAVALAHLAPVPILVWGGSVLTRQHSPLPSVLAMVVLALSTTIAWWAVGIGLLGFSY